MNMNEVEVKLNMKEVAVLLTILGRECKDFEDVPKWYRAVSPIYYKIREAQDTLNIDERLVTEEDFE